jgi:broad specificity phosphatase PhoE
MTVVLVRHAECELAGTLLGQRDAPLTAAGTAQAGALAAGLGPVEIIVSSDLLRARATAEILARAANAPVQFDPRLREISYGVWDGLTWTEIEALDPEGAKRKLEDWYGTVPSGGEPFHVFEARVNAARASLVKQSRSRIAVVAHLGVNAVLSGRRDLKQPYGSAIEITLP